MKVYYFSPETGVYQGEGFLNFKDRENVVGVTTVPPPDYDRELVPVFSTFSQQWTLCRRDTIKTLPGG